MPKEVLHGDDEFRAVVTWRKDEPDATVPGNVQLAVLNATIDDPDHSGAAGWFKTLDADQIDYLISVLRKARRQAFPDHNSAPSGNECESPTVVNVTYSTPGLSFDHNVATALERLNRRGPTA